MRRGSESPRRSFGSPISDNHFSPPPPRRPSFKSRMSDCQSDDAGASPADRTSFQKPPIETGTVAASLRSLVSKTLRARGSTEEEEGNNRGRRVGEQRRCAILQIAGEPGGKAAAS